LKIYFGSRRIGYHYGQTKGLYIGRASGGDCYYRDIDGDIVAGPTAGEKAGMDDYMQINLKQYGLAARMYLDDNEGSFPYSFSWLYKDGGRGCRWHDASKNLDQNPDLGGVL